MKTPLLAALAAVVLSALAPAQLVMAENKFLGNQPGNISLIDVASGTYTGTLFGTPIRDIAIDEAGGVMYLLDATDVLLRWPFGDPAPTVVGAIDPTVVPQAITFGNGKLYGLHVGICGDAVFSIDPASPGSATVLSFGPGELKGTSLAFDQANGLIYLPNNGAGVGACSPIAKGIYAYDPIADTWSFFAPFPAVGYATGGCTVGNGKLWFAAHAPNGFENLDLTSLTWDPSPPVSPVPLAFGLVPGLAWSPTLAQLSSSVSYCTAGTSASGCTATLSSAGTPSATAGTGFTIDASGVEGQKDGLYFFGANGRQANTWGSGTSFQCVQPPVRRGGLLLGTGTTGACDGSFSQDLNALWIAKPAKNPGAGALVQAQLWYRDPFNTSNQTTSLSDALEFTVAP